MNVLLCGEEGKTEVDQLEALVGGAPHDVGGLQVGVHQRLVVQAA